MNRLAIALTATAALIAGAWVGFLIGLGLLLDDNRDELDGEWM